MPFNWNNGNLWLLFCTILLMWTRDYYLECAFLTNQSRLYYLQHLFYLALKSAKWSSISLRLLTEFFLEWSSKFFENEIEKEMLCSLRRAFLFYQHFQLTVKTRPRLCTSKINFTWKGSFSNSEHCLLTIVCKNLCLEWLNFLLWSFKDSQAFFKSIEEFSFSHHQHPR